MRGARDRDTPRRGGSTSSGCRLDRSGRVGRVLDPRQRDVLPVDDARGVPILQVVSRLGLGEPRRVGKESVLPCPLHDDSRPSLRLNPARDLWHCFPCGEGGDGIRLVERVRGVTFTAAVLELAGC